ncbi:MAG: HAD family hydrolase [Deltaproteobacteria bacterium]|nr:HAD family hydrolase [Deltaproteobacteria bacterium]
MNHKAVIFDLDGTLLNTIGDLTDSMNLTLSRFGFKGHDQETYKYFVGDGIEALVQRALPPENRDEETVARCVAIMREEYALRWDKKTRPYPGIPELLDALSQKGWPISILSNKPDDSTQMVVAKLLPRWSFQIILGSRPSVPKKPDPTAALEIAGLLNLSPAQFIYLGDTGTDMKTALRAGMFPVGALWGFRTAQELMAEGAQVLIEKPLDLLQYL